MSIYKNKNYWAIFAFNFCQNNFRLNFCEKCLPNNKIQALHLLHQAHPLSHPPQDRMALRSHRCPRKERRRTRLTHHRRQLSSLMAPNKHLRQRIRPLKARLRQITRQHHQKVPLRSPPGVNKLKPSPQKTRQRALLPNSRQQSLHKVPLSLVLLRRSNLMS